MCKIFGPKIRSWNFFDKSQVCGNIGEIGYAEDEDGGGIGGVEDMLRLRSRELGSSCGWRGREVVVAQLAINRSHSWQNSALPPSLLTGVGGGPSRTLYAMRAAPRTGIGKLFFCSWNIWQLSSPQRRGRIQGPLWNAEIKELRTSFKLAAKIHYSIS